MATIRGKKRSATVFSRDAIGVEQLQSLKEKFADGDLNEAEFVSLFREIIDASLSETQLIELFQKIDANSDGTVDWDELTNYMFLSGSDSNAEFIGDDCNSYYETTQPDKFGGDISISSSSSSAAGNDSTSSHAQPTDAASNSAVSRSQHIWHHKDIITRVVRLDKPYLYLTASKDGSVRTWNAHTLAFQNVLCTGKNWLTDVCVMKRSNRLAVASMNRTLGIYDLGSNQLIGEITDYSKKQAIPLCLEYVEKPADDREALIVGDDTGGITVMTCSDQWLACDGRATSSAATATTVSTVAATSSSTITSGSGGGLVAGNISTSSGNSVITSSSVGGNTPVNAAGSAHLEAMGFSSRTKFKKHTDWVTRVKWVHDIRAVVATSLDTTVSILDIDRLVVKFEYNRHKKGVFDLVWCASTRLIASCGMERDISIWNPYSSQRAVATLRGHTSAVLHLASDDDNYQLISVASDNTIKVWDVRNHRCLQTFVDRYKSTGGAENRISALLYDAKQPCLISATTHLTRWPLKVAPTSASSSLGNEDGDSDSKERCMCLVSYNGVFHQVVTAEVSADSVVKTWSAETGDEICSFANAHGENPVTAISFDTPGRRLLTGGHDGELLKMWNFSNGALVKQFCKHERAVTTASASAVSSSTSSSSAKTTALAPTSSGGGDLDNLAGEAGKTTTGASGSSPRKRKVRDIMMLPASFGIDQEGRRGGPILTAELPSPTRMRMQRGQNEPAAVISPSSSFANSSLKATGSSIEGETNGPHENLTQHPSKKTNHHCRRHSARYKQQEVTSILDIERNLRVGMGDFICQRFVCCVGWDRRVFVWADKNDESEAFPTHVLPNDKTLATQPSKAHSMDILALVYIPPAYIATSGLDGQILLWSLNSGEFVAKLHQNHGSIEVMVYAQKLELLLACGENGQLICIDRSMATQAVLKLTDEMITAMKTDKSNTHLITGDASGMVQIWEIQIAKDHDGVLLQFCYQWQLGHVRVLGVDIVEHTRISEFFVLLSCANGDVSLWTLDGVQIGCFGKHRAWQLGRPSTYMASKSSCNWSLETNLASPSETAASLPPRQPQFIRCCAISTLNTNSTSNSTTSNESFLLEDSMPKAGEVWVCVSGHRSRATNVTTANKMKQQDGNTTTPSGSGGTSSTTPFTIGSISAGVVILSRRISNNSSGLQTTTFEKPSLSSLSYLQQRLAESSGDITELITVIKVTRGEILCWDGYGQKKPVQKVIEMSEFVRKTGWVKHNLLSQFIGRLFMDGPTCFQATAVTLNITDPSKPDKKSCLLIDTTGGERDLQPLNESVSMARVKLHETAAASFSSTSSSSPLARVVASSSTNAKISPRRRSFVRAETPVGDQPALSSPTTQLQSLRLSEPTSSNNSNSHQNLVSVSSHMPVDQLTTSTVGMGTRTLPLIKVREKRVMGGLLPKRSNIRSRHDQCMDFRRIHNPDDIPKNFRMVIHQKNQNKDAPFEGILPE